MAKEQLSSPILKPAFELALKVKKEINFWLGQELGQYLENLGGVGSQFANVEAGKLHELTVFVSGFPFRVRESERLKAKPYTDIIERYAGDYLVKKSDDFTKLSTTTKNDILSTSFSSELQDIESYFSKDSIEYKQELKKVVADSRTFKTNYTYIFASLLLAYFLLKR